MTTGSPSGREDSGWAPELTEPAEALVSPEDGAGWVWQPARLQVMRQTASSKASFFIG